MTIRYNGVPDAVDIAFDDQELARMIRKAGIKFTALPDASMTPPLTRQYRRSHIRRHRRRAEAASAQPWKL